MLRTYLLKGLPKEVFTAKEGSKSFVQERDRGIVVSNKVPKRTLIVDTFDGDQAHARRKWLEMNALDDLHAEYQKQAPVPVRTQVAALDGYQNAIVNLAKAEQAALKAKAKLREAAAKVVRTHGKTPVTIDGETYVPGYSASGVVWFRKAGGSGKKNGAAKKGAEPNTGKK